MSQTEFAYKFSIALRTLQDWEQGRRSPDRSVRAYLKVIEREPHAVRRALAYSEIDGIPKPRPAASSGSPALVGAVNSKQ